MKIGFDAKRAFLNTSGLGNYSRNTLNALQKYFPEQHYTLFTPREKIGMLNQQDSFEIVEPPHHFSKLKKAYWRTFQVYKEAEKKEVAVFHGLSNELPNRIHRTGIPSVVTIHDLVFKRYPRFYKPIDRLIYMRKTKYACRAAHKIVAISQQTKEDIIRYTGTKADKIEVIHQAISPLFFEPANLQAVKEKFALPENFLLAVGTIEERKNQLSILQAMQRENIDLPLVLVGNPTAYCNDLHKFIARTNMQKQVIFLKNIEEAELAAIYQMATLSIYISVYEGFGLPVIEAMASGCPVITSNVSCLPETAGDAAVLCSPGDSEELGKSIQKILTDTQFKQELIRKGKVRAELFRPQKYAEKLISLYQSICNE